jgi:hypothetical protein
MEYYWAVDRNSLGNVYSPIYGGSVDIQSRAEEIVIHSDRQLASLRGGALTVEAFTVDRIIYREIVVTARRVFTTAIDLSFIGFPRTVEIVVTSTAVVSDGDEFIRNFDLATDFANFISKRFGFSDAGNTIGSYGSRFKSVVGIR